MCRWRATYRWKALDKGYNFALDLILRGLEKGNMHPVIVIELTTIVSLIVAFEFILVPMFFHMEPLEKSKVLFKVGALLLFPSSLFV
jgi:hypothetical protein